MPLPHWPSPQVRPALPLSSREPSRLVHEGLAFHTMAPLPVLLRVPGAPTTATNLHCPSDHPRGRKTTSVGPWRHGSPSLSPCLFPCLRMAVHTGERRDSGPMDFPQGWASTPTVLTWASAPSPPQSWQLTLGSLVPGACMVSGSPSSYGSPGAGGLGPHPSASWDTSRCLTCAQRPRSPCISPKEGEWAR